MRNWPVFIYLDDSSLTKDLQAQFSVVALEVMNELLVFKREPTSTILVIFIGHFNSETSMRGKIICMAFKSY